MMMKMICLIVPNELDSLFACLNDYDERMFAVFLERFSGDKLFVCLTIDDLHTF